MAVVDHSSHQSPYFSSPALSARFIRAVEPSKSTGLIISGKRQYTLDRAWPKPVINASNEVRISIQAVGLNPIDLKYVVWNFCLPSFPWTIGREASGIVESVGSGVTNIRVGDRVWTTTYYRDVRAGTLQSFCVVPCHTVGRIPRNFGMIESACLGVPALTAAMTLWKWLQCPLPVLGNLHRHPANSIVDGDFLLIWGGATATGQFLTQFAKLPSSVRGHHLQVITVVSNNSKSLSLQLGADHAICRDGLTLSEIADQIRIATRGRLRYAVDLVGTASSLACFNLLRDTGHDTGFCSLALPFATPEQCRVTNHPVEMKQFILDPSNRVYMDLVTAVAEEGLLRMPTLETVEGLAKAQDALQTMKNGGYAGKKVVVRM